MAIDRNDLAERLDALRSRDREELAERVKTARREREDESLFESIASHPIMQRLNELGSGITRGAAQVADLPGRAVTAVTPGVEAPEGGFFERHAENLGLTTPAEDEVGEVTQTVGENIGASAIPGGMMVQAGRQALGRAGAQVLERGGSLWQAVRQMGREALETAGRSPGAFLGAETAAATGAGIGGEAAERLFPDSPMAEQFGQTVGAFGPAGLGILARGLLRGGNQATRETLSAFEAAGTTPTAGQATRNPALQAAENLLTNVPGAGRIASRAAQMDEEIGNRVSQLVDDLAVRSGAEDAGRAIERGIEQGFLGDIRATAGRLYQKLDNLVPSNRSVEIGNTKAILDELTGPVQGAEALSGVLANSRVVQIRQALEQSGGRLPYGALKDLRTHVGNKLASTALIDDVPRGELKRLYGALSQDMEAAARAEGEAALRAYNRANRYYQAGITRVDEVLQKVVDKADPADIFRAATRSGFTARGVMKSLDPEERSVVTAAVLQRMGRATPGNQDELGELFSPQTFLTNWNKLSPEAKRALFDWEHYDGLRGNLDKIAEATAVLRDARRMGSNPSGTGRVVGNLSTYGMLASGILRMEPTTAGAGVGAIAGANAASRLLTSPRFVGWLAESRSIPPERIPQHLARLTALAEEEDVEFQRAVGDYLQRLRPE